MDTPTMQPTSRVRERQSAVRVHRAHKYRALLLHDRGNNRLRKRYLDYRTPQLAHDDMRLANRCLAAASACMSTMVLILVGILGGVVGAALLAGKDRPAGTAAVALAIAMGSTLCGAVVFAVLALRGWVMFDDLLAEFEAVEESSGGAGRALRAAFIEAWGGSLWGTVFGVGIGLATGGLCGVLGFLPAQSSSVVGSAVAGAVTMGALVGAAQLVTVHVRGPNKIACEWARLGPLPLLAYTLPYRAARYRYLR
jgi:hypothetical protein